MDFLVLIGLVVSLYALGSCQTPVGSVGTERTELLFLAAEGTGYGAGRGGRAEYPVLHQLR